MTQWVKQLIGPVGQQVIPIDGKNLRGSYDRKTAVNNLHLVTAWTRENRLVLGQVKVKNHSNEITAIAFIRKMRYDITDFIGDKLRLKARCQGNFRWWLKEQGLPSADGLGKGSDNQLNLGFSLSFDNP